MALPPLPSIPPAVTGTDFISAFIPPIVPQSSADTFNRIVDTALATNGPLPTQGLQNAVGQTNLVSLLDQSLFRDLVSSFDGVTGVTVLPQSTDAIFAGLGIDGLLGRSGLPQALSNLDTADSSRLTAALAGLFSTVQALGGDIGSGTGPNVGSLLDVSA